MQLQRYYRRRQSHLNNTHGAELAAALLQGRPRHCLATLHCEALAARADLPDELLRWISSATANTGGRS